MESEFSAFETSPKNLFWWSRCYVHPGRCGECLIPWIWIKEALELQHSTRTIYQAKLSLLFFGSPTAPTLFLLPSLCSIKCKKRGFLLFLHVLQLGDYTVPTPISSLSGSSPSIFLFHSTVAHIWQPFEEESERTVRGAKGTEDTWLPVRWPPVD